MKRKIALLLIFTTCIGSFSSFAVDEKQGAKPLKDYEETTDVSNYKFYFADVNYSEIYDLVLENNKTLKSNDMMLDYIQTPPGKAEGLDALWNASQAIGSVINMVNNAKLSIDLSLDNEEIVRDSNLYIALTAGQTALQLSKSDLDAQIESLNPTLDEDMESMIFQFDSIKQQIIWGSQSLFMAYLSMDLSIRDIEISKASLETTISALEKRYELGQIAEIDLINVKANISALDSALATLSYEKSKLLYDLNLMMGREYDSTLSLSTIISPDLEYLETIDLEADFQSLLDLNYNYYTLLEAVDEAKDADKTYDTDASQNAYDMALLNLEIENSSMRSAFMKIYSAIAEKQRLIDVEIETLANKELNATISQVKYDLGLISLDTHNATLTEFETQELKVETAQYNLFVAIEQYKWATNGMITG